MAYIIETFDPFQPMVGMKKHQHPGGITIRQWLQLTYPGFVEFEKPTICIVNGNPVMRSDWDREIEKDDIVNFIGVVGYEWVAIIIVVIVLAISIVLALTMKTPVTPGELPSSHPVFSNAGKINAIRLGEPIEVSYGRNRIYPSLASRPYFRYEGNDQFQHSLLCLGQGEFDIEDIFIGDTPIDTFEEVEYQVIGPGEGDILFTSDLFATQVVTSVEVGGQILYGTNQPEYVSPGWVGPFPTNPAGTDIFRIEIDLVFLQGLYATDQQGRLISRTCRIEVEFREIDDAGNPLTAFEGFFVDGLGVNYTELEITKRTTTPQRLTFSRNIVAPATFGRFEVRARRTNQHYSPTFGADQIVWEGMKGFIAGAAPDWGDVTLLAVKIRATNNLNTRTQEKFNVVATRKLSIRDPGGSGADSTGWTEPIVTRSIVWAFVDIFRSTYGGRITDEIFYDWDALVALDELYTSREEYFDWTFRDPITVWDAARAVARVGRAVPLLSGSLITMRRDGPLSVPVTLFTPDNIVRGPFQWDIKLWEPNDFDSVAIEYTDPTTGYQQEIVVCTLPGGTSDHPEDVRLVGVQDRNHAYHEGLFLLATEKYLRENISFETGMEGFIPSYGDLVMIAHDVPRWAQFGYVLAVEELSGGEFVLHVSEPLVFGDSAGYQILLRGSKSEPLGPYDAEEMSDPMRVLVVVGESDIDFLLGGRTEPMLFLFGVMERDVKKGKVVKLEPQGGERVKITLVNDAPIIHTFDVLDTAPLVVPVFPDVSVLTISSLSVYPLPGGVGVGVLWPPVSAAEYYVVQLSYDEGESWTPIIESIVTGRFFEVSPGAITVRVAAVSTLGQGPWIEGSTTVSPVAGLMAAQEWEALEWEMTWWPIFNISKYQVQVFDDSESAPVLKRTEEVLTESFSYDYAKALVDGNVNRKHRVEIDAIVPDPETGIEAPYELPLDYNLENSIPLPPLHPNYELDIDSVGHHYFRFFWDNPVEDDTITVKLWVSVNQGFDPNSFSPVVVETASAPGWMNVIEEAFFDLEIPSGVTNLYWRVGLFDVWGEEIGTNVSEEMTIPV